MRHIAECCMLLDVYVEVIWLFFQQVRSAAQHNNGMHCVNMLDNLNIESTGGYGVFKKPNDFTRGNPTPTTHTYFRMNKLPHCGTMVECWGVHVNK